MRLTRTRIEEVTYDGDTICNKCGETCMRSDTNQTHSDFYGVDVSYTGGYFSGQYGNNTSKIKDEEGIYFSLCENCLSDLIETFMIPPNEGGFSEKTNPEIQAQLNQVQYATKAELAVYATSEFKQVRAYAIARLKKEAT